MRKHTLLLDLLAGRAVPASTVTPLDTPMSPVGGHHHHTSGSAAADAAEANPELAPPPPLPGSVSFTATHNGGHDVHAPHFHLLTADLRDVAAVQATLTAAGIDFSVPTLFLSE